MIEAANRLALRRRHPRLAAVDAASDILTVTPSKAGPPTLVADLPDGRRISFHSHYDPAAEGEKIAAGFDLADDGPVYLLGLGLGYVARRLADRLPPDRPLVIVEPSTAVFSAALGAIDMTPLFDRPGARFVVGENEIASLVAEAPPAGPVCSHPPSVAFSPTLADLADALTRTDLAATLAYPKCAPGPLRVLLFTGDFFLEKELATALAVAGDVVRPFAVRVSGVGDDDFIRRLLTEFVDFRPDVVVSVNRIGFDRGGKLAALLDTYRMPSAVWFVDNPVALLHGEGANASPHALTLVWDRTYVEPMRCLGYTDVRYFPYAADDTRFAPAPRRETVAYPVSFVGSSMAPIVAARMGELVGEPELAALAEELGGAGEPMTVGPVDVDAIRARIGDAPLLYVVKAAADALRSRRRRGAAMNALAQFDLHVFGDAGWGDLLPPSATLHPPVDYHRELAAVYRRSAINVNVANVQLRHAVNQRLFDVTACGAFLLTDGAEGVADFFPPGTAAVALYETAGELAERVAYYLNHAEERESMATTAMTITRSRHTYRHRVAELRQILAETFAR